MCNVDVAIGRDEVLAEDRSEELRRVDRILLSKDVDGLLLGVCCDDGCIVCLCVAALGSDVSNDMVKCVWLDSRLLNVALEKGADSHLGDMLDAVLFTTHLVQADVVLAVAGVVKL